MQDTEHAIRVLRGRLDLIRELRQMVRFSHSYQYWSWRYITQCWLEDIFGESSSEARAFGEIDWAATTASRSATELEYKEQCFSSLSEAELLLHRFIRECEGAVSREA